MKIRKTKLRKKLLNAFGQIKSDSFSFELIESYFRKKEKDEAFQVLTDKTCHDLDFQELFMFVDRTTSRVGQQYLFQKLRTIPGADPNTQLNEDLIDRFTNDVEYRLICQEILSNLTDKEAYHITSLFQDEHICPPKWLWVARILSATSLMSLILVFFDPVLVFVLFGAFIINFAIHYWNKRNLTPYIASIPQLLKLNRAAKELLKNELLNAIDSNLDESISVLDKVRNRMSFFKLEAKLQGDMEAVAWGILELIKILFILEPLLLFSVLNQLDTKRKEIEKVFSFVGQVDVLLSIASLRKGLDSYCKPVIISEYQKFTAIEVYHPLILECVKNSIEMNGKSVLLTGSNMSGKTSFIRTIGLNVLTGLTLNTCFARQLVMPRTKVFSAIRISDDLMNDKSYYFEEVLTIKEMLDHSLSDHSNLFLLDEIFKGTNTVERISAGKAVLSALTKANNLVFVSTHDIELADLLSDEYELYHFSETVNHQTVDFDYKLKAGKLKNRNAIRILQLNGYPDEIIEEAMVLSAHLDRGFMKQYDNN
jgi:hypothetical protein